MTSRYRGERPGTLATLAAAALAFGGATLIHPLAGVVIALVAGLVLIHPFEPVTALATLAVAASFVDNGGGHSTRELAVVTVVALYALVSVALARANGRWRAPGGALSLMIGAFLGWTLFCAIRGALAGNSLKFLFLELAGLGTMAFAWIASGLRVNERDLQSAMPILIVGALGHVALGGWSYVVNHIRTGGIWYTPYPGMFAVFALAFALHSTSARARWGWTILMGLCLWHQTISFSRGLWFGLLAALPWTMVMFAGIGRGSAIRWRRVLSVAAIGGTLLVACTLATAMAFGWSDLLSLIGTRFGSSFAVKYSGESASNVARLLEYASSFRLISREPWLGYGLGLEIRIREPFFHVLTRQWYIHHSYLWLCLKEGLVGFVLLLAALTLAIRCGIAGARSANPKVAAWSLSAAGVTIYLSVASLTTYYLAQVNAPTLQAVLWGFTVALQHPPHWQLVWSARRATPSDLALTT